MTIKVKPLTITYTNWRGETSVRSIVPKSVRFGATEWHPEPQWLLAAFDTEKGADREFAMKDFVGSSPATIRAEAWRDACKGVLEAYDKANPFRTADCHSDGCHCFRCRMDAMRALIDKEQDQ